MSAVEVTVDQCLNCGYSLQGLPEPRCPECGVSVTPEDIAAAALPWERERSIGSFFRTVIRASKSPRTMGMILATSADPAAARSFGRWCRVVAAMGCGIAMVLFADVFLKRDRWASWLPGQWPISGGEEEWWYDLSMPWLAGAWHRPAVPIAVAVGVWFASGILRDSVQRRGDQRLEAAANYAMGSVAFWPLCYFGIGVSLLQRLMSGQAADARLTVIFALAPVITIVLATLFTVRLASVAGLPKGRAYLAAFFAFVMFLGALAVVPWAWGMASIALESVR